MKTLSIAVLTLSLLTTQLANVAFAEEATPAVEQTESSEIVVADETTSHEDDFSPRFEEEKEGVEFKEGETQEEMVFPITQNPNDETADETTSHEDDFSARFEEKEGEGFEDNGDNGENEEIESLVFPSDENTDDDSTTDESPTTEESSEVKSTPAQTSSGGSSRRSGGSSRRSIDSNTVENVDEISEMLTVLTNVVDQIAEMKDTGELSEVDTAQFVLTIKTILENMSDTLDQN